MSEKPDSLLSRGGAWVVIQFLAMTLVIVLGVVFHGIPRLRRRPNPV